MANMNIFGWFKENLSETNVQKEKPSGMEHFWEHRMFTSCWTTLLCRLVSMLPDSGWGLVSLRKGKSSNPPTETNNNFCFFFVAYVASVTFGGVSRFVPGWSLRLRKFKLISSESARVHNAHTWTRGPSDNSFSFISWCGLALKPAAGISLSLWPARTWNKLSLLSRCVIGNDQFSRNAELFNSKEKSLGSNKPAVFPSV